MSRGVQQRARIFEKGQSASFEMSLLISSKWLSHKELYVISYNSSESNFLYHNNFQNYSIHKFLACFEVVMSSNYYIAIHTSYRFLLDAIVDLQKLSISLIGYIDFPQICLEFIPTKEGNATFSSGGGGYLVYLSDGDVPFFMVSLSPISSGMGYQMKAIFLQPVLKTCQTGNFVRSCHYLVQFLCFGVYYSWVFSRIGYHLKAKILALG